jgi:glycosyltransferase involved in cell wall biosynthesis
MKIAFIIQNYNYNGGGQVTASLAKYLQSFGHDVSIIVIRCDKDDVQSRPNNFSNVIDLHASNLLSSVNKLSKIFQNSEYGIFICVGDYSNLTAGLAKLYSKSSPIIIGSEHFGKSVLIGDYSKPLLRFSLPLYKLAYIQLNGLVFVSDNLRSEFLKKNSWHPSRCITIYNPVRSFRKKPKKDIDFEIPGITYLGMGVLEPRKRFDLLLKAFARVAHTKDILLIAGTGSQKQKLEMQAIKLGIKTQVKFLGYVNDVDKLMQVSNILVLTSNSEALPMVLLEGLAAGLQIVSTNSFSGPAEILKNDRYGYLAEVDNIDSIVSSIKKIKNKPIPTEIIEEGASRFYVDQIANKYLEFISNIMMSEGNINEAI